MSAAGVLIAVVDDDESVRRATRRLLCAAGFQVETYSCGTEFLDAVKQRRPSCVILDLHMPGPSGLEVQNRLNASGVDIPVIFITADDDPGARQRALRAGAVSYVHKPWLWEALLEAIHAATCEAGGRRRLD